MTDFKTGDVVTFCMPDFAPWQGGKGIVTAEQSRYADGFLKVEILEVPPTNNAQRVGNKVDVMPEWIKLVEQPSADMVNGPSHYGGADNPYEAIKVAEAWGFEKNAYLFNALKYLARAEHKGRKVEDLKKLQFYVAREISLEEAK